MCRSEGLEPVIHPHAGTYIETADEIARVMDAMDPSIIGLCLDTGHFRFGGADPARAARDYHELVRHVHVKDCKTSVMAEVKREGKGLDEALRRGIFCPLGEGDVDTGRSHRCPAGARLHGLARHRTGPGPRAVPHARIRRGGPARTASTSGASGV